MEKQAATDRLQKGRLPYAVLNATRVSETLTTVMMSWGSGMLSGGGHRGEREGAREREREWTEGKGSVREPVTGFYR